MPLDHGALVAGLIQAESFVFYPPLLSLFFHRLKTVPNFSLPHGGARSYFPVVVCTRERQAGAPPDLGYFPFLSQAHWKYANGPARPQGVDKSGTLFSCPLGPSGE